MTALAPDEVQWLQDLLETTTAIQLDGARSGRVGMRLAPVAQRAGVGSVSELISLARRERRGPLIDEIIDAIATHETSWFRDNDPWKVLSRAVVPEVASRRGPNRPVRIWSAACSSGQEPYSIALALTETMGPLRGRVLITASDFSASMVERAAQGRFSQLEMNRGMPARYLVKYFQRDGVYWRVNDDVRSLVTFEQRNLVRPFDGMPTFDVVCLRNVLIYFDLPVRARILEEMRRVVAPDGWLLLGSSETLLGLPVNWDYTTIDGTVLYRPKSQGAHRS
ncbi:MAG: protein-glutamate O-methyltransferase CheR [Acidimicrobiales bacterium]